MSAKSIAIFDSLSDTSVAAKTEIRNENDVLIYFRFIEESSVLVILELEANLTSIDEV